MAPQSRALIAGAREHVGAISAQRIRHELDLMLEEDKAVVMLRRLAALDLLRPIHASLPSRPSTLKRLERRAGPRADEDSREQARDLRWVLWLVGLTTVQIRSVNRRLHFRRELVEAVLAAAALHREAPRIVGWKPSRLTAYLDKSPILAVQGALQSAANAAVKQVLQEYLTRWRELKPVTTGKDLKTRGLPPGPAYRVILAELRRAWLDGSITSPAEENRQLEILLGRLHKGTMPAATASGPSSR
jgi:tRNA nucleotidyltransferase (CCA-adding enzyme)